jgi:hypothetical protein
MERYFENAVYAFHANVRVILGVVFENTHRPPHLPRRITYSRLTTADADPAGPASVLDGSSRPVRTSCDWRTVHPICALARLSIVRRSAARKQARNWIRLWPSEAGLVKEHPDPRGARLIFSAAGQRRSFQAAASPDVRGRD